MTFRVGQKVVCVNTKGDWSAGHWGLPEEGKIYHVRAIVMGFDLEDGMQPGLLLEEIRNGLWRDDIEYSYQFWRFRPIVERETDISIFTSMLNPSRENMDA